MTSPSGRSRSRVNSAMFAGSTVTAEPWAREIPTSEPVSVEPATEASTLPSRSR